MRIRIPLLGAAAFLSAALSVNAQVSLSTSSYFQTFDTLTSATWTNDSTLDGWYLFNKNSAAITTLNVGTGNTTTGGFYSFGAANSSDRALGALGSGGTVFGSPGTGAVAGWIALAVTNNTGATITSVSLSYSGEQWRNGGNTTAQTMTLQYGFGTEFSSVSSWTTATDTFSFTSPVTGTTAATVNGNSAGLVSSLGGSLTTNWQNNDVLWLRWVEVNDAGNDHGLAIDNFSLTATYSAIPEPSTYAALFGAAAMIGVAVHRRRARAA